MSSSLDARAPPALRQLHALFASVEFGLSSLALYQRSADWAAVKLAVESSSQSTLTKDHLQQMMWLAPSAYVVSWSRRPASRKRARANGEGDDRDPDEPVLLLRRQRLTPVPEKDTETQEEEEEKQVVASETLTDRIEFFTKRVNEFIEEQIAKIQADKPTLSDEDLVAELEDVEIGRTPLPELDIVSVEEQAHQRLKDIAKKTELAVSSSELQEALAAPVPEDLQTLPKWLVDKVRRTEQLSKKASERTDAAQKQRLYTTLPQLSDQIQSLVLVRRKHVFPLKDMARQLLTKAPIREQIEEQIHLLESMVPFWITVFYSDGKEYVKVSKSHKYNAVKGSLRDAIKSMV